MKWHRPCSRVASYYILRSTALRNISSRNMPRIERSENRHGHIFVINSK